MKTIFISIEEFAGGGGATTGHKIATGRSVDVAVNHSAVACAMHAMNHPETLHFCQDVWQIDPLELLEIVAAMYGGAAAVRVAIASGWFSPDCKHFSKAKGGALVDKRIRGLAYIILKWCGRGRRIAGGRRGPACPLVLRMENVEEFKTWGPLVAKRDPKTGRVMLREVRDAAGVVLIEEGTVAAPGVRVPYEHQWLVPDTRRAGLYFGRFVRALEAMGGVVEWRELRANDYGAATSRKRLYIVVRFDGEAVVWPEATHGAPESPAVREGKLQPHRAAYEIVDWALPVPSIFLPSARARALGLKRPLVENSQRRIAKGVKRFVMDAAEPFFVTEHANASGQRNFSGMESMRTQCAQVKGGHFAVVAPFLAKNCTGSVGQDLRESMPTLTANGFLKRPGGNPPVAVCAAFLAQHNGGMVGHAMTESLSTLTAKAANQAVVFAHLVKYYGTGGAPEMREPLHTVTTKDRFALVEAFAALPELTPERAKMARRVAKFLRRYGVNFEGEFATVMGLVIYDIGTRMFAARELFDAMGFPADYIIDRAYMEVNGRRTLVTLPKHEQVMMVGNAVSPPVAAAIIAANQPRLDRVEVAA